jgi:hypothetical protein
MHNIIIQKFGLGKYNIKERYCGYYRKKTDKGVFIMDNNKNRIKDREKSKAELRKMRPKENADLGIINGQKIGVHEADHERSRAEK